jgi:hypothetical protein
LPPASSERPGSAAGNRIAPLCALAPGGACRAARVATGAVRSYRTVSPLPAFAGGLFSVALSRESPRLAVSQHPALWSPDFPPARLPRRRPPGRVLSPRRLSTPGEVDIPLGPALPRASSELTRERGGPPLPPKRLLPYLLLLRVGLAVPPLSPEARCALAAPFHPCPCGRSFLCGAVPRVASAGR